MSLILLTTFILLCALFHIYSQGNKGFPGLPGQSADKVMHPYVYSYRSKFSVLFSHFYSDSRKGEFVFEFRKWSKSLIKPKAFIARNAFRFLSTWGSTVCFNCLCRLVVKLLMQDFYERFCSIILRGSKVRKVCMVKMVFLVRKAREDIQVTKAYRDYLDLIG